MKILYLAHRLPDRPDRGNKLRAYHHIRHLAMSHEVHVIAFADGASDATALRAVCRSVEIVPLTRALALARGAAAMLRGASFTAGYFGAAAMWRAVRRANAAQQFDVAWAYCSSMAPYLAAVDAERRIADFVDVDSEKFREYAQYARAPMSWAYRLEAQQMRALEARGAAAATRVLFVSEDEAVVFRPVAPTEVAVCHVRNGVDTAFFQPMSPAPSEPQLVFVGALDYLPNAVAARCLIEQILPRVRAHIPKVGFTAVGHRPPPHLLRLAAGESVRIAGSVPDVRPYLAAAQVFVAPMRFGRGVKNKVLEAMAMGVPVVASSIAMQGLAVSDGVYARIADEPEAFAAAVVELLGDVEQRRRLADNALRLVRDSYAWEGVWPLLDQCLQQR